MGKVILSLENGLYLNLFNIAYTPECNSNFISLDQLQESSILYYNHLKYIVLKQEGSLIRSTIRKENLFVFNTQSLPSKAMLTKGKDRPI